MTLNYGWFHIERGTGNAMQLGCERWSLSMSWDLSTLQDIAGDTHIGFDLGIINRVITLHNTYFKTTADIEAFLNTAVVLNAAGTSTVEIQISSAPAYFNFKSGEASLEMLFLQVVGVQKVAFGNGTVYKVEQIKLRQAG